MTPALSFLALGCWVVMFLAGTDIWHEAGRPDFWSRDEPPYPDVRAFVSAFYLLFLMLTLHLIGTAISLVAGQQRTPALTKRSS